jgi:anti-anti-sigma regulatory factor
MEMKGEAVIKIREILQTDFPGLRVQGEVIREKMEEIIREGKLAILDFEGVRFISHTFADEIVGIFTRAFGVEWLKSHVKATNANDAVRDMLNLTVKLAFKQHLKAKTRE